MSYSYGSGGPPSQQPTQNYYGNNPQQPIQQRQGVPVMNLNQPPQQQLYGNQQVPRGIPQQQFQQQQSQQQGSFPPLQQQQQLQQSMSRGITPGIQQSMAINAYGPNLNAAIPSGSNFRPQNQQPFPAQGTNIGYAAVIPNYGQPQVQTQQQSYQPGNILNKQQMPQQQQQQQLTSNFGGMNVPQQFNAGNPASIQNVSRNQYQQQPPQQPPQQATYVNNSQAQFQSTVSSHTANNASAYGQNLQFQSQLPPNNYSAPTNVRLNNSNNVTSSYQNQQAQPQQQWQQGSSDRFQASNPPNSQKAKLSQYAPNQYSNSTTFNSNSYNSNVNPSSQVHRKSHGQQVQQVPQMQASALLNFSVPSISSLSVVVPSKVSRWQHPSSNPVDAIANSVITASQMSTNQNFSSKAFSSRKTPRETSSNKYMPPTAHSIERTSSTKPVRSSTRKGRSRSRSHSRQQSIYKKSESAKSAVQKVDFNNTSAAQLSRDYNVPVIGRHTSTLVTQEFYLRFPKLYIPADFVRAEIDWNNILYKSLCGTFNRIHCSVSMMMEASPILNIDSNHDAAPLIAETAKFTNIEPINPIHNHHMSYLPDIISRDISKSDIANEIVEHTRSMINESLKPIKYNARVIVSLGFRDTESDIVDSSMMRKLRILMGRRKGTYTLLGGPWCRELDGGDPSIDRSCLENTARRTILSQSLIDISHNCTLIKLCELTYHRPQEEFKGKAYPEQDEISVIYLCTIHNFTTDESILDVFNQQWETFDLRASGRGYGPHINCEDVDTLIRQTEELLKKDDAIDPDSDNSNKSAENIDKVNDSVDEEADGELKEEETENTETSNSKIENAVTNSLTIRSKPDSPCLLICSQPMFKDQQNDSQKINDALALKVLSVTSVLSYTEDDTNERLFEASFAAEVLKNSISISFANIIADVLLEFHDVLNYIADPRIKLAIRKLQSLHEIENAPVSTIVEDAQLDKIEDAHHCEHTIPDSNDISNTEFSGEHDGSHDVDTEPTDIPGIPHETDQDKEVGDDDHVDKKLKLNESEIPDNDNVTEITAKQNDPLVKLIDEEDAKMWREYFISACRWFDVNNEKFLNMDHLQLILQSSARDISRSDINAVVWNVCNDEKFFYENLF